MNDIFLPLPEVEEGADAHLAPSDAHESDDSDADSEAQEEAGNGGKVPEGGSGAAGRRRRSSVTDASAHTPASKQRESVPSPSVTPSGEAKSKETYTPSFARRSTPNADSPSVASAGTPPSSTPTVDPSSLPLDSLKNMVLDSLTGRPTLQRLVEVSVEDMVTLVVRSMRQGSHSSLAIVAKEREVRDMFLPAAGTALEGPLRQALAYIVSGRARIDTRIAGDIMRL